MMWLIHGMHTFRIIYTTGFSLELSDREKFQGKVLDIILDSFICSIRLNFSLSP